MLLLVVCLLICSAGCTNNSKNTNTSEPARTPTMSELKKTIYQYGYTIKPMLNAISSNISDLKKIGFSDINTFVKTYKDIYGNFDLVENQETTYTNTAQMAQLASAPYTKKEKFSGPILLVKNATLTYKNGSSKPVNVLFLNGTDLSFSSILIPAEESGNDSPNNERVIKSAAGFLEYIQSGMGLTNEYTYDAYYVLYNYRKQLVSSGVISDCDKPDLIIVGLSLGGLIAQQVASLEAIQEQFNVINVVSYGSPIIAQHDIANTTKVQRRVDTVDVVPKLSVYQYDDGINGYNSQYDNNNAVVKTGVFDTFIGTHSLSYVMDSIWGDVDVLGFENGGAKLTFTYDKKGTQMTWYPAPKFEAALANAK